MITIPTNGDVTEILASSTMSSTIVSDVLDFEHARNGSIQCIWTGNDAADGELSLLVSNESGGFYGVMPDSEQLMSAGGGSHLWILTTDVFSNRYIKVNYDKGSNTTGSIRMIVTAHGRDRY